MGFKKDLTAGTYEGDDIPKTTKWVYSVSGMFRDALYALVSGFLTNYIMYSGVLEYECRMNITLTDWRHQRFVYRLPDLGWHQRSALRHHSWNVAI
jgi:hypothetical protein